MSGKEVFRVIAKQCFEVGEVSNVFLTGKEQHKQVVKELAKRLLNQQPSDFQQLVSLLKTQLSA